MKKKKTDAISQDDNKEPEDDDLTYIDLGDQLIEQGDFDGAIAVYTGAISSEPDDGFIYQLRADAYKKKGDLDNAIADYTKAISLYDDDEDRAMAYIYRAVVYIIKGEYHNVMDDANAAIKTGYLLDCAYLTRGTAYINLGPMGQAFEDWKKAADLGSKGALIKLEERGIKYKPLIKKK